MVCRQVVGALVKHFVVKDIAFDDHIAAQQVVYMHFLPRLDKEAHHILFACIEKALNLIGRQCQRITHLHTRVRIILEILDFRTFGLQFLRSIKGDISLAGIHQLLHIAAVNVAAFALLVRSVGASFAYALVNTYTQPSQSFVDIVLGSGDKTLRIGILDA